MENGLVLGSIDLSLGFFIFGKQAPLWIGLGTNLKHFLET